MSNRRTFLKAAATVLGALSFVPAQRALAQASGAPLPDLEIELTAAPDELPILPGRATAVWRYKARVLRGTPDAVQSAPGTFAGPLLGVKRGDHVRVHFLNRIPQESIVHWHGMLVPERMDGHPRDVVGPGETYVYDFRVENRAGTYWFHPHPHHLTGLQVYAGLAGMLVVTDDEEASLRLPDGDRDLPFVLSDRTFDRTNQLFYAPAMGGMMGAMMTGVFGDVILTNGRHRPVFRVASTAHRVRLLNASNARIYRLTRSDSKPVVVIAGDGGLLSQPRTQPSVVLAPGERAELWLDLHEFGAGGQLGLIAEPLDWLTGSMMGGMMGRGMMGGGMTGGMGGPGGGAGAQPQNVGVFAVERSSTIAARLPARLAEIPPLQVPVRTPVRRFTMAMARMQWSINGRTFVMEEVAPDERVRFGDTEIWEFTNLATMMAMPHPMHVHGVQFRVLRRDALPARYAALAPDLVESGVKDTVLVFPGERVRILITFDAHPGLFAYHCHNLEHGDMGMMRNFEIASAR